MIRLGLDPAAKETVINHYLRDHEIKKVFVFYPEKFPLAAAIPAPAEHVEYADIIMYKYFYRLLEEIDNQTLLVFNECMRTQNRSDLTYNCAHHYCNQTEHKIVFEHFPFIEDRQDFMILLDLLNKGKYKGKSFDWRFLREEDVKARKHIYRLQTIDLPLSEATKRKYEAKKEQLFDDLGNKEPDTIPRQLHVWSGNLKKGAIEPGLRYIARNDRFKLPNVITYKQAGAGDYILIDFAHRRLDLNDFWKQSGMTSVQFINSGLKVDLYYINEFRAWVERLEEFYAQTSLHS